ncbi:30S ribosome-binding factor RbfA [candidate division WOR-3 bacterium]|uniref:Ribosome-binding factor A n=1 Tax=candidate division WOR-3 bacterium TaxID=2052148 RepID=A0A660SKR9_UNCW3|nr:MAG: 30S ribosome-binding factor RbfA [candidate division WOR-3 bacterium]
MRNKRVAENIKRELAKIIQESSDPRFIHITITGAEVTRDLKYATIYFTTMNHPEAGIALRHALGYIRSQLAQKIKIKYLPQLRFREDKSYEYGQRIDELLDRIKGETDTGADQKE